MKSEFARYGILASLVLAAGALLAGPREFKPLETARPRPADFDAYWDGEIARQKREVPLESAEVKTVEVKSPQPGFRVYDVEIPALSKTPARGILTVPAGAAAKSLPIVMQTMGAGSKSAYGTCHPKAIGFCINPYGALNRQDDAYYTGLFRGELNDYMHKGWESRETCWFHGQIMRLVRALEWVKTVPEWNGRDLIVHGKSMGGSQALQAAALDRDVTVCAPEDPAMCDHAGERAATPRRAGWPQIESWAKSTHKSPETIEKYLATADYFDNCHFAARIRCKAYFASGYCDGCCPSEGVYIAYANAKGEKLLTVDPTATHCRTRNVPFLELLRTYTGR